MAVALTSAPVHAAGLFSSARGVRPLARAGAFVAGADDVGSIWYNPAGLADTGFSVLADFSWLHYSNDFTRVTQVRDSSGALSMYQFPSVSGKTPFLPLPTLGASFPLGRDEKWTLAGGVYPPYVALTSYPQTINGTPASTRYSLVSLDGTALAIGGGWVSYKPIEQLRIGAGLQALVGTFNSTVVLSTNPADRLIGAPEDPQYDSLSQVKAFPVFSPSANFGIIAVPFAPLRIGVSGQLPFSIDASARVTVRLPNAPEFDNAAQQGTDARLRFKLPAVLRLGVEVAPLDSLRVEVAYVREFWHIHRSIDITPTNIQLLGVTGFPSPYNVPAISVPRNFRDTNSIRLGLEYSALRLYSKLLHVRAGFSWEQSAIPDAYLAPLTVDLPKYSATIGAGVDLNRRWRIDAVYAHVFGKDAYVSPSVAAVPRINPVKGNPVETEAINGGNYSARADIFGLGVNYRL